MKCIVVKIKCNDFESTSNIHNIDVLVRTTFFCLSTARIIWIVHNSSQNLSKHKLCIRIQCVHQTNYENLPAKIPFETHIKCVYFSVRLFWDGQNDNKIQCHKRSESNNKWPNCIHSSRWLFYLLQIKMEKFKLNCQWRSSIKVVFSLEIGTFMQHWNAIWLLRENLYK